MEKLVENILNIPAETQIIEFKRLSGKEVVKKIIRAIVGMANAEGGAIILGIDDPEKTSLKGLNRIYGIEEDLDNYDAVFREIENIIPPVVNIKSDTIKVTESKTIALLHVSKATECFLSINNQVWIRLNKGNKKLTPQEIIKMSYAKGFEKADNELVDVDFDLLQTSFFDDWRRSRKIVSGDIRDILFQTGLAKKNNDGELSPLRAAVLLFAQFPTNLMDTKCAVRVYKHKGAGEMFQEVPNLIGKPKTIEGPIIDLIKNAHEYILGILESGIEMHSGFVTKYKVPERAVKEAITNAVIHRDYNMKRDIEVKIFESRIEIVSPGLFPYNITKRNIGRVRADGYRNDLLVKHLREFSDPPNLDRNEGVQAMRNEMDKQNLFPPMFFTYPFLEDSVETILFNEERPSEWEKVSEYLKNNKYITNKIARGITGIAQMDKMSKLFKKWVGQGFLEKIVPKSGGTKGIKYKLSNNDEI